MLIANMAEYKIEIHKSNIVTIFTRTGMDFLSL